MSDEKILKRLDAIEDKLDRLLKKEKTVVEKEDKGNFVERYLKKPSDMTGEDKIRKLLGR